MPSGDSPDPSASHGVASSDPRVDRTRAHVLAQARSVLAEQGPVALTYSALAARARVSRQTLYRHWPSREALLADCMHSGPVTDFPAPSTDATATVTAFLRSLRDAMDDPGLAGAFVGLVAAADHHLESHQLLTTLAEERRSALNELLRPSRRQVSRAEMSTLVGALFYQRFIARQDVTDTFIADLVARWTQTSERHGA